MPPLSHVRRSHPRAGAGGHANLLCLGSELGSQGVSGPVSTRRASPERWSVDVVPSPLMSVSALSPSANSAPFPEVPQRTPSPSQGPLAPLNPVRSMHQLTWRLRLASCTGTEPSGAFLEICGFVVNKINTILFALGFPLPRA